jgi:PmbA protein
VVASNGFSGKFAGTGHGIAVAVLAGEGAGMERDDDWDSAVHAADLKNPAEIGRRAGERAVARLKARKAATARVPVVYDPRVSNSLLRHLAGAINGASVARGLSFLKDKLDQRILPPGLAVIDDPHIKRGHRSVPFDAEGVANRKCAMVEDGVLLTWFLDSPSARQLKLRTTGHARRGSPGPSNLYLAPGAVTAKELIAEIENGFYVTELMGMGVNGITGDYSRGASGFWIERGQLSYPVHEVTVAGNLKDMFLNLRPASDLEFRTGIDAPTLRIEGMTVAGA